MKILVIGQDPNLFNKDSENFKRIKNYAGLFEEFHVISATSEGLNHVRDGNLFLWPTNSRFQIFRIINFIILGRRVIKRYSIDLIDAQDAGEAGVAAFFLSYFFKIPFRVQIHTDIFSPYFRRASWKECGRYLLAKFLIPRANCIRVVSERIKKSLMSHVACRISHITVLPIFTDVSKFLNSKPDPITERLFHNYDFKMIAAGRFVDKEKNFSMLIAMMRGFVKICPNAVLVLVGEGPDRSYYQSLIVKYGLEDHVMLESWRSDLSSFYKSFDLYLLSSNYEGWGRTVIEAIASGLPVVMTDVGIAGEIVKDGINGFIVPVGEKNQFLHSCEILYHDPEKRMGFITAGYESLKNLKFNNKQEYFEEYKKSIESCNKVEKI